MRYPTERAAPSGRTTDRRQIRATGSKSTGIVRQLSYLTLECICNVNMYRSDSSREYLEEIRERRVFPDNFFSLRFEIETTHPSLGRICIPLLSCAVSTIATLCMYCLSITLKKSRTVLVQGGIFPFASCVLLHRLVDLVARSSYYSVIVQNSL